MAAFLTFLATAAFFGLLGLLDRHIARRRHLSKREG
jgi:hypothetical protein